MGLGFSFPFPRHLQEISDYSIRQRGFAVLPDLCHHQDYDRFMLYPAHSGSPKMCADEGHDEAKESFVRSSM